MRRWSDIVVTMEPREGTEAHRRYVRAQRVKKICRQIAVAGVAALLTYGLNQCAELGRDEERQISASEARSPTP